MAELVRLTERRCGPIRLVDGVPLFAEIAVFTEIGQARHTAPAILGIRAPLRARALAARRRRRIGV